VATVLLEEGACPSLEDAAARDCAGRLARAEELGISYREYTAVLLDTGQRL
jgi:hypothetical protein